MFDILVGTVFYILNFILLSEFLKGRTDSKGLNFSILMFHYHVLIGFYYGWFAQGTDTTFYWNLGDRYRQFNFESWFDTYGTHNNFVFFLNYPFSKVLELNYWTGTFLYANVSAWAFVLLFLAGQDFFKIENLKISGVKVWPLILLLPSLHFWSSGIGKDSLVFLFMSMLFYGMRDLRKYVVLVGVSAVLLYHVRPHMAFIVLFSAAVLLILDSKLHLSYKLIFFMFAMVGFVFIFDEVLKFLKIEELSAESIEGRFAFTSENLSYGKSFVDMSGYPYPLKVLTFLYRPLFFDAHNFSSLLNSVENLISLLLTVAVFARVNPLKGYQKSPNAVKIMILTFLIASISFAGALSNFGIMVRMKNMTFIYFLFFLIYIYDQMVFERYQTFIKKVQAKNKEKVLLRPEQAK
ncbi:hypothetical protein M3O96_19260 [Aquiflexum sp. TKW24L]|uniref:hypothetical protein n=1 Tax=Aquiflexum sp. TKW24L TaxID=2942212 RepID=UPI0020C03937|nr:hypothetical protein [Aquiflexum sp. TKW24L]MCL6261249.1 hypothetical protein [Aquiflexum sp. TKW24L]